jgi:hypothetical protein
MDERIEMVRDFFTTSLWEADISNVAFISPDSWISPYFFDGLACPLNYFNAGFCPPFLQNSEFIVLICPPTVVNTTEHMSLADFELHLNTWLWRIYKYIETALERNETKWSL